MNTIKRSSILISEDRQRQHFDEKAMVELRESIELSPERPHAQLQNAPVLRLKVAEDGSESWWLVSGERRLRAIDDIFAMGGSFKHNGRVFTAEEGLVPFVNIGELGLLDAEEAELAENFRRANLTWQEHAAAVERLHNLRAAQKAAATEAILADPVAEPLEKLIALSGVNDKQSHLDTALEVYGSKFGTPGATVRNELLVAKHLDNPEVAKAKTLQEAVKIIRKDEVRRTASNLAAAMGKVAIEETYNIINGDCIAWMADPANHGKFDVILTDAPYGMGAQDFGDGGGKMTGIDHQYDDSFTAWRDLMEGYERQNSDGSWDSRFGWCELSYLVTKPQAHAYVFCDIENFPLLKKWMEDAGWYVFRTPLIAYKLNSGRVPLPDQGPRRQYETILYAIKGNKPVNGIFPDVIPCEGDENMGHGAQKPVALFENLLRRSVKPGDHALDSFAGTGPLLEAGVTLGIYTTLIETVPAYYGMCLQRAARLKAAEQTTLSLDELLK